MKIAGVLLAAGRGRRFGSDSKLTADLGGRPVVDWAAAAMEAAGIAPRVAVVRAGDAKVSAVAAARGFDTLENLRADEGVATSIAAGVAWAEDEGADGVLIALGDMPFVTPKLLMRIGERFIQLASRGLPLLPAVAVYDGERAASPALFARNRFAELKRLTGDQGARSLLGLASVIACEPGELDDVDTPEALEAARRRLEAR
jgi:molybdenum cofactor cytidylyltransferase